MTFKMDDVNTFEKVANAFIAATREAYRFAGKGVNADVIELWSLSDSQLNAIFAANANLEKELNSEDSLTDIINREFSGENEAANANAVALEVLRNQNLILGYILRERMLERKAAEEKAKAEQQKKVLIDILNRKEQEDLAALSADQIKEMLNSL